MSLLTVIRLFLFWQLQAVALALMLLLPLVSYLAAVKRRPRRRREPVPPAEQAGR